MCSGTGVQRHVISQVCARAPLSLSLSLSFSRSLSYTHTHTQVAAACLYIYCRQETKPYMLIDFSDHLSINVYRLGAVYLQVCVYVCDLAVCGCGCVCVLCMYEKVELSSCAQ